MHQNGAPIRAHPQPSASGRSPASISSIARGTIVTLETVFLRLAAGATANIQHQGVHPFCRKGVNRGWLDDTGKDELAALRKLAATAVAAGALVEVNCDEKTVP